MTVINRRSIAVAALFAIAATSTFAQSTATDSNPKLETVEGLRPEQYVTEDKTYALPWERLPEKNILWQRRVWREINVTSAGHAAFSKEHSGNNLASILLQGAFDGKIKAYSTADDRFTKELSRDELIAQLTPGKDNPLYNPANVDEYSIKEDWLFLKDENKLIVRILGIAPVGNVKIKDGVTLHEPLFWIYYPDAREFLAQQKNAAGVSWDQVFEGRSFTSHAVRGSEPRYPSYEIENREKQKMATKK